MLEYLRNASNKPLAKILMGVLIFSFVGWGVADWIFGATMRDTNIATIGGKDITAQQFNVERTRAMARMSREQQKRIYNEPEFANAFNGQVLSDLINNTMIELHARELGFVVTDKRIAAEIKAFPEFQSMGQFSPQLFYNVLMNSGFTEDQFAEYLRSQTLRSYTLGALSMPVNVPNFVVNAAYNARYGIRSIEYKTVKFSDFKVGNPTDEQLKTYYAQNPKIIPESRAVSYVLVTAQMDKPDSYEAGLSRAQKLEDAVIAGEPMATAASKQGAKFVSLPAFSKDNRPSDSNLTDSMISKIFAMDAGMESELIETKQGFLMVRVEKVNAQHAADFDSVKSGLISGWKIAEQKKQAYLSANEVLVDLNKTSALKDKISVNVSRASGAPTDVLVAAYKQASGTNAIVASGDAFYVLRVVREIAPQLDTLKMAALRKELQSMSSRELMEDYNSFLIREYPIKVNQKVLDKMTVK